MQELSSRFQGTLLTISDEDECVRSGDFDMISIGSDKPSGLSATWDMYRKAKEIVNAAETDGNPIQLIVAYDPLKIGLMGVLLSRLSSAKLAVEINGEFASDGNYLDYPSVIERKFKKTTMLLILWVVLKFCTGAKLLHKNQLGTSTGSINTPIIRIFLNYVDLSNFKPSPQNKEVLFVGFPFFFKGVDLLIAAFKKIAAFHIKIDPQTHYFPK